MEAKKKSAARVEGAKTRSATDDAAIRKIARAVIAIATRQIQGEESPATSQPLPSKKGEVQ